MYSPVMARCLDVAGLVVGAAVESVRPGRLSGGGVFETFELGRDSLFRRPAIGLHGLRQSLPDLGSWSVFDAADNLSVL
jgi:hypothetical protein